MTILIIYYVQLLPLRKYYLMRKFGISKSSVMNQVIIQSTQFYLVSIYESKI